jgi:serine/threonine-protein kinase RsbW
MIDTDLNLEIKLPKVPDIELVAIQGLEKMGGYFGISEDKIGEARVLVTEAIINGLEHSGDDNPNVSIEFKMTKEKLIILVTDSGKGFDPNSVPTPEIKNKLGRVNKRGWGLKLMKSMSDDLMIESKPTGTKISIIKHLG